MMNHDKNSKQKSVCPIDVTQDYGSGEKCELSISCERGAMSGGIHGLDPEDDGAAIARANCRHCGASVCAVKGSLEFDRLRSLEFDRLQRMATEVTDSQGEDEAPAVARTKLVPETDSESL